MGTVKNQPYEFRERDAIEYFLFEEDFIENGVRCIPMIVRFKMDAVKIKLKLSEWNRFTSEEKSMLAIKPLACKDDIRSYEHFLTGLIKKYTSHEPTLINEELPMLWKEEDVPQTLSEKALEFNYHINPSQWRGLSDLQRFALLKLCRPGHENKNFPLAMKEFGLI